MEPLTVSGAIAITISKSNLSSHHNILFDVLYLTKISLPEISRSSLINYLSSTLPKQTEEILI